MLNLPSKILELFNPFAPVFYGETTWEKAKQLVVGTILSSGKRTVSAALQVMGLKDTKTYAKYHHVLNRAAWSSLDAAKILLGLLEKSLVLANEPLIFGIDETIERRWGQKISARGIYRDPVRSSKSHFVKTSGLRWISLMLLAQVSWAKRTWALPVLTALAPSERYYQARKRQSKSLIDRAKQMIWQIRRWLPHHALVFVGDSSYAALDFLSDCQHLSKPVTFISRLRMDAALYQPAPAYAGKGRPRKKGKRLPTPQQYLSAKDTSWEKRELTWYGGQIREMEVASQTAVWFHFGKPPVPITWVLVRDPLAQYEPICLLATDASLKPQQIAEILGAVGSLKSLLKKVADISALKLSVSGPTKRLNARHRHYLVYFRGLPFWQATCSKLGKALCHANRLGMLKPYQPLAMHSPLSVFSFGTVYRLF